MPWVRVRTDSEASHDPDRAMPPLIVHATVVVFIGSLDVTTRFAPWATVTPPSGGPVDWMNGLTHSVVKLHGVGTAPGTRSRLSFWSFPPGICAGRPGHSRKGGAWPSVGSLLV